jgi:CubicO group peptidase (beta-lactamase class C family)
MMPNFALTRRRFLAVTSGLALAGSARGDEPPVTGVHDARLESFDRLMTGFLKKHKAPGAALAVARHGKLVYARGFGYANRGAKEPVRPDALFRIASVSKPITAAAVLRLVDQSKLKLDEPIVPHLKLPPHRLKDTKPDPRWETVTVRQCLQHTGGWDRDKSFDPIGVPWKIAKELGREVPVPPDDVIRYMLARPLDFDPGARHAYSNLGYLLLGRAIETTIGKRYDEYVKQEILGPLGITRPRLARALPEDRPKAEVAYYEAKGQKSPCLYPPRRGKPVSLPDGAENVEAYAAHGGWIASAPDLVKFACAFDDPARCPILSADGVRALWARPGGQAGHAPNGKPKPRYYGCGWEVVTVGPGKANTFHTGYISGTSTILVRRFDGLSWAVLFNSDQAPNGDDFAGLIDGPVHEAADAVTEWPAGDLFPRLLR